MNEIKIDAKNKKLGRLASEVAIILQGKNEPSYDPRLAGDNIVIIENIEKIRATGKKMEQKKYYRHSGYVGNLKEEVLKKAFEKSPEWVLRHAVYLMLPKNKLRKVRIKRLKFAPSVEQK